MSGLAELGAMMKQKTSQTLYSYWNDVRGDRMAPRRFEIEPARISDILPETFILERTNPNTYRFRLAGTKICEQFGNELRGSNFLDPWSVSDRITLERQLFIMADEGAAGVVTAEGKSGSGTTAEFEIIILPLIHTREKVDRFLGSWTPVSKHERPHYAERFNALQVVSTDLVWPDGRPHSVVEKLQRQSPFLPHVRTARIVRSDKRQFRVYDGGLSKPAGDKP